MRVNNPTLNKFEEAAFSTATGKIAYKLGFTKVDLNLSPNPVKAGDEIEVFFIKP